MKTLYIRADGNEILGLGHLMRCMSIADAYRAIGGSCEFIVADNRGAAVVEERGYQVHVLESNWEDLHSEIDIMKEFVKVHNIELLLVDSYYVDETYFLKLNGNTKLIYLTGKKDKAYPVDVLINYTIGSCESQYIHLYKNKNTKFLLGEKYAPLRKQFDVSLNFSEKMTDIFITTGGTDGCGLPLKLLKSIEEIEPQLLQYNWHIVVGKYFSDTVKCGLKEYQDRYNNIFLYENVKEMASLMQHCNIGVSAAGSTLYELCACGIPIITFSFVDNQINNCLEFEKTGFVYSVGDIRENIQDNIEKIMYYLNMLSEDENLRKMRSKQVKKLIDGKGARRLAEEISLLRGDIRR